MDRSHAISEKWGKAPVAIAGDFNSTPNVTFLYSFLLLLMIHLEFAKFYHFAFVLLDAREIAGTICSSLPQHMQFINLC